MTVDVGCSVEHPPLGCSTCDGVERWGVAVCWPVRGVVEQRLVAILEVVNQGRTVTEVAERYGVARQTVHRWLRRPEADGLDGLEDRSHRPKSCPHQIPVKLEPTVVALRRVHRSWLRHRGCAGTATTVKKTRPRRPQTNGKVQRFHHILMEEWAYIRPWTSETQRSRAYAGFIQFYNHHRSHGSLGRATPATPSRTTSPRCTTSGSNLVVGHAPPTQTRRCPDVRSDIGTQHR